LKYLAEIFDNWLTRAAGIIFLLIIAVVLFNIYSPLPEKYPLFGVFTHSLAVILFVAGGIIFVLAILKSEFGGRTLGKGG
ncbi:MAG: hypothetical protein V1771_02695, partial [Chloroflexota bacterium]